jgi:hypothetical protein
MNPECPKFFLGQNQFYKFSNKHEFHIEKTLFTRELEEKPKFKEIVEKFLIIFMRYFGYDLSRKDQSISVFQDILKSYLDSIFKVDNR